MAANFERNTPLHSRRLRYRAPESPEDDTFFLSITNDINAYMNSNITNATIPSSKDAKKYQEFVMEKCLLGVVICLQSTNTDNDKSTSNPIGAIHLTKLPENQSHHRSTEIGIEILQEYQGKGYGSEAIRWIVDWAFERLGLHRVQVRAFGWNVRAIELYKRLGFKEEGRWREALWHEGKWWDDVQLSILEDEWKHDGRR
ncbi:acyl-CoA N-acyltransferase [Aureobasidium melanogenum CBS 110374]|uniref:Acyl-CoA N-acyltransferase n=1 Tax=Aureobasidium melanogenum (strain CBS 110374) TaxID=1043003 RepID=A0A074VTN0_AURM1|nr:acyl-CoA N-acyltransferase [Aureobasidium melanogenum CBS 110374]KEQ63798.1 acyl-CoA N-acyltransferase [Aureobasidium melanogenum CBS 110374]